MDEYVAVPGIWAEVSSVGRAHSFDGRLPVCSATKNHNIFHNILARIAGEMQRNWAVELCIRHRNQTHRFTGSQKNTINGSNCLLPPLSWSICPQILLNFQRTFEQSLANFREIRRSLFGQGLQRIKESSDELVDKSNYQINALPVRVKSLIKSIWNWMKSTIKSLFNQFYS